MGRRFFITFLSLALLSTAAATAVGAQAQPRRPIVSKRLLSEAPDYASTSLADPWDFGQERDLTPVNNLTYTRFTKARVEGGRWKGTAAPATSTTPAANIRLVQSWNSLPQGRDGELSPIDADKYTHISIRMRMTGFPNAWGEVSWYDCGRLDPKCRGAQGFRVLEGWQTYDFELERDPLRGPVDWAGDIRGLVITPTARGGDIEIDWVRVYKPTNSPVTLTARDTDPDARLIWDRDRRAWNNNATNPNWGVISEDGGPATWNTDAMFPARYFVYSETPEGRSLVNEVIVNKRPRVRVLQPDATGGVSYDAAVRGDAWDFTQASDVSRQLNMSASFSNGQLVGTNTSSDSGFRVTIPADKPVNGSRFTNFSARVFYEGDFSLSGAPGGGMNARLVWRTTTKQTRVSEDIVVLPGWQTITVDLDDTPPSALIEGGDTSSAWDGKQIELFRFDPHEDSGPRRFFVDWIKLAENDKPAANKFRIAFRDLGYEDGSIAQVYLDRNGDGIGDHQIATRSVVPAHNVFTWTVPTQHRGTGEWFVTIKVTDPSGQSTSAVSTGKIQL